MTAEEWARYVEQLRGELKELAQNIMRRVSRLINKDRSELLESIQTLERRTNENAIRWRETEDDGRRFSGQIERLEERIELTEAQLRALAERMAQLQRNDNDGAAE